MRSIIVFLERQDNKYAGTITPETSPQGNWRKEQIASAMDALRRGRISTKQFQQHKAQIEQMAKQPGGLGKSGTFLYAGQ